MKPKLLTLEGVCKYYTSTQSVVMGLNNISVSFDRGEFVAITGESGSGKSTLAHVLGGILPYESGELLYEGKPTSHFDGADYEHYRRDNISFISQNYGILPGTSVLENVVSALRLAGMTKREARDKAKEILTEVELWDLRRRRAAKLSSGQKQRLSIARALAKPAPILIADEPTGNLDPENSAKVIELLAHAAKERLVILITHEFSEAADYVTRHIVIQEGRIAMDMPLKPAAAVSEMPKAKQNRQTLSPYVAGLQLRSRPVWSALVLAFFALTAFAVFAFLGTFIVNLDDTDTRVYDNSAFRNGSKERIVAARTDGEYLTQEDHDALVNLEYVASLERYGYVTDVQYAWQENIDFYIDYTRTVVGDPMTEEVEIIMDDTIRLYETAPFVQTVPVLPDGQEFLTAGRLPESYDEIVLCGSESRIGETVTVYFKDFKNWAADDLVSLEATVVGITDRGSGLYFSDEIGRSFSTKLAGGDDYYLLMPNETLEDDQFLPSESLYLKMLNHAQITLGVPNINLWNPDGDPKQRDHMVLLELPDAGIQEYQEAIKNYLTELEQWLQGGQEGERPVEPEEPEISDCFHSDSYSGMLEVSLNTLNVLAVEGSNQVSLTIEDYAYTDRVLAAVQGMGYLAVSPFQQGSTTQNKTLADERMQTLTVCLLALLAVVVLQIIVLRALYTAQTESYRTLSNMGLTCGMAKRSALWQILALTALGQVLGFGIILICRDQGIERIVDMVRYLPPALFAVLCAVHLAASLVSAVWIMNVLGKQVYPMSRRESDMQFEEEEA